MLPLIYKVVPALTGLRPHIPHLCPSILPLLHDISVPPEPHLTPSASSAGPSLFLPWPILTSIWTASLPAVVSVDP